MANIYEKRTFGIFSPVYMDQRISDQLASIVFDDDVKSRQMKAYKLMQIIEKIESDAGACTNN